MGIKISELPSGTADQNAVVPVTNAAATETRKVTLLDIASLATKQTVGLGNVDNTSDADKPISSAVQAALDGKQASGSYVESVAGKTGVVTLTHTDVSNVLASPDTLTTDVNNYALSGAGVARLATSSGTVAITGIEASSPGDVRLLINVGTNNLTLKHASTSSSAANRFLAPNNIDYIVAPGDSVAILYDGTDSRWRIMSAQRTTTPSSIVSTTGVLVYAETLVTNTELADIFDVTLLGSATLDNPVNPIDGRTLRWRIKQSEVGNCAVTLGNKFVIPSSATTPLPFSTTANAVDLLAATYSEARDKWDIIAFVPGY
jgi:hypothetical protein